MKPQHHVVEVILDSCVNRGTSLEYFIKFSDYVKHAHHPVNVRLVYTPDLYREQTHLLAPYNGRDIGNSKRDTAFAKRLHGLGKSLVILKDDKYSEKFKHAMLEMAKAVEADRPSASYVTDALSALKMNYQEFHNLRHLSPQQAQIIYDYFVAGVKIKRDYKHIPEAHDFRAVRNDNADCSIHDYLQHGRHVTHPLKGQKKLIILLSCDAKSCEIAKSVEPYSKRVRAVVVGEEQFPELLSDIMQALDRVTPAPIKIPPIYPRSARGTWQKSVSFVVGDRPHSAGR